MISRDSYIEKRFMDQERQINTLKRKGCETCKATGSAPKLARRTDKEKQTVPIIQSAEEVVTPAVPQPMKLTTVEVMKVKMEVDNSNDAGIYQATLAIRGKKDENYFYNWK